MAADIHAAVRANDPAKLQEALDAGDDINLVGPGGQTPLMHGVLTGTNVAFLAWKETSSTRTW